MDYDQAIDQVAASYAQRGYDVIARPESEDLPPFAKDFKIQVVGKMPDIAVLVAIKRNRDEFSRDPEMRRYATITEREPGWRFDFVLLEENSNAQEFQDAQEPTLQQIQQSLVKAEKLVDLGYLNPAFISAWSAFEAAMRMAIRAAGETAGWGTTPRELMNELVSAGIVSQDEFVEIEKVNRLRNQIVHGFVSQEIHEQSIQFLIQMSLRLLGVSV